MPRAPKQVANYVMELTSVGPLSELGFSDEWETEIGMRIREIEEGREVGVPYEEVMRSADLLLAR